MNTTPMPEHVVAILSCCIGPEMAITLDELAVRIGMSRRETEQAIKAGLRSLPFVLVSGSEGLYRPTSSDQINAYIHNLHSRHHEMAEREDTVRFKARASGWREDANGRFMEPAKDDQLTLL